MSFAKSALSLRILEEHFHQASKPRESFRIGVEHEKIGVVLQPDHTVTPLLYEAPQGQPSILRLLHAFLERGWQAVREGNTLIALQKDKASISLEPGGQFEFSGSPLPTAHEAILELHQHLHELLDIATPQGIAFLGMGFRPFGTDAEIPRVPKRRYEVMRAYLPTRGTRGLDMMHRTATIQANLDYADETDAMKKLHIALALGPLVTALFAASPLRDGQPTDWQSLRAACWLDTDPDRCGLLPFAFQSGAGFREYVAWALDVPLFFVRREGHYHPVRSHMTFRQFAEQGWQGHTATLEDWDLHLSTLFPDARLRGYIETRTADAGPLDMLYALPCLWRGLLYDTDALQGVYDLVKPWSYDELMSFRHEVPRTGLHGSFRRFPVTDLLIELLMVAEHGLQRLHAPEEAQHLKPLWQKVRAKRSVADEINQAWEQAQGQPWALSQTLRLQETNIS